MTHFDNTLWHYGPLEPDRDDRKALMRLLVMSWWDNQVRRLNLGYTINGQNSAELVMVRANLSLVGDPPCLGIYVSSADKVLYSYEINRDRFFWMAENYSVEEVATMIEVMGYLAAQRALLAKYNEERSPELYEGLSPNDIGRW